MSTTFTLGTDATMAVGPIGVGVEGSTTTNLSANLLSFSKANDLFAGISLEGAAVAAREVRNTSYDNAPTKTIDILVLQNSANPKPIPCSPCCGRPGKPNNFRLYLFRKTSLHVCH